MAVCPEGATELRPSDRLLLLLLLTVTSVASMV